MFFSGRIGGMEMGRWRRKLWVRRQWDLGFMMGVIENAMPHWPWGRGVHRLGSLWSVTCPAFGFMCLFSLPAPIEFLLNGEPEWGGYSNTTKSFYHGPYVMALLHFSHGPVIFRRPFLTFEFHLTTVQNDLCWFVCQWVTLGNSAFQWSPCRFIVSRPLCSLLWLSS